MTVGVRVSFIHFGQCMLREKDTQSLNGPVIINSLYENAKERHCKTTILKDIHPNG